MSKKIILSLVTILFLGLLSPAAAHAGFGISPSDINSQHLRPGDHLEKEIVLSRSDPIDDLEIVIEPSLNEMTSWFKFDPGMKFTFPKGQKRLPFKITIDVPHDAPLNRFEGVIRIKASEIGSAGGGVSVVKGARLDVELMTTDLEVTDLLVRAMSMEDVGQFDPLKMNLKIENVGNTKSTVDEVKLTVMDLNQQPIKELSTTELEEIDPYTTKEITAFFDDHGLELGEYFGVGEVIKEGSVLRKERMVFRVNEGGEARITLEGEEVKESGINSMAIFSSIALLGLLGVLVYAAWRVLSKKKKKNHEKLFNIILAASLLFVAIGVIGLVFASISSQNTEQAAEAQSESDNNEETQEVVERENTEEEESAELTVTGETEGTESAEVQGVSTENTSEPKDFKPLVVSKHDGEGYPIYESPDYTSRILHIADEGDSFDVLDENSRWYQVSLDNGVYGWLPKNSVKTAD